MLCYERIVVRSFWEKRWQESDNILTRRNNVRTTNALQCLEVLEKETFRYVTVQRKFYEKKIKGKWKGFKVEMDGLDRKEFGRFVEGLRDGKTIKVDGVEEVRV